LLGRILHFGFAQETINPYNYLMLAVLSVAGAMMNYHLTVNYISEKNKAKILNDSLEIIANHDSITRLQNRYALNQLIPEYIGRDICIAMGDINNFKGVNDTYGHHVGDDVLKAFSDILSDVFPDECVYRFGGDEFLVIELGSDIETLQKKLRRVNERFSQVRVAQIESGLGCSFGCITACPKDPSQFFEYLTQADQLLYQEKEKIRAKR
jgi:diguanylate cyclase (GGDEF)-like protein